jgi:serine/threonine protein phosphatase PrpC
MNSAAATIDGNWSERNDMRVSEDPDQALYYVADASGPTYGGYFAPFGIEPGLAAFASALREAPGRATEDMRDALLAAHRTMKGLSDHHQAEIEKLLETTNDRQEAELRAADAVRPPLWSDLHGRSFAHFGGQITACWFPAPDKLVVGQVGTTRVYRLRGGRTEQLVPDHGIASVAAQRGVPGEEVADLERIHADVTTSLLGLSEDPALTVEEFTVRAGDRFVLCTVGVYVAGEDLIDTLLRTPLSAATMAEALAPAMSDGPRDAAALCIEA